MRTQNFVAGLLLCAGTLCSVANGQVVISQVYGGGGNSGSVFNNDFIELYNRGTTAQSLAGWSVQYASATGSSWQVTNLTNVTLQPGQYYLVQQAAGAGTPGALPAPDATGTIAMSGTAGKVALVSVTTALTGTCPTTNIVDFVGFGTTANCSETSPTSAPSNSTAVIRANGGCTDTGSNAADFAALTPTPRNTSTVSPCPTASNPTGAGASTPANQCPGYDVLLTVNVTPGANPTSTGLAATVDLTNLGGSAGVTMFDNGTNGDVTANDSIFSAVATVFVSTPGNRNLPITIIDGQGRTGNASVSVLVNNCSPAGSASANPSGVCTGESTIISVATTAAPLFTGGPDQPVTSVLADLSGFGLTSSEPLFDNATNGDTVANDGIFARALVVPTGTVPATRTIVFSLTDAANRPNQFPINTSVSNADCVPANSTVVISQVYGGGGNTGAIYNNDFVELFNRGSASVDLTGYSLQYGNPTSLNGFTQVTALSGSIAPGSYVLVQFASGGTVGDPLPVSADIVGTTNLGASAGKLALVSSINPLGNVCDDVSILDLVGYGNSTCSEGIGAAANISNTTGLFRRGEGCFDTNNNAVDFRIAAPLPRNSASGTNACVTGPTCGTADFDGDGDSGTDADIESFFACLAGTCCETCFGADFDGDGDTGTDADIEAFFRVLAGQPC